MEPTQCPPQSSAPGLDLRAGALTSTVYGAIVTAIAVGTVAVAVSELSFKRAFEVDVVWLDEVVLIDIPLIAAMKALPPVNVQNAVIVQGPVTAQGQPPQLGRDRDLDDKIDK